ncbi:MAG: Holliday junction branch migration protein RuvA [Bacteroidota bacterium]|jgi:Holliday junction DNA helicase RuvA|nr:Holliday junction branch migration protein RuvA [Bacteroidota bacterium]MEC7850622.1 Holliday junction branch migration protein RuvA [Bacteroidota bacterium]MEC8679350.1 Holliday junction branch migration protein RuvA [Bacteroidota bacterium]MEC8702195.1 Holliday junction branch migration protein RuvA [Bacteroidota bacterium]|tara:strand:- start:3006 stop:3590 length:585 start_codon:yes stop_codon:yes gene_type:complete
MISFIRGKKIHIDPAKIIIEVNGIGYDINISLRTYSKLKDESEVFVYTHLNVKEDSHTLYGFNSESERNTFLSLLSINGVGPSTAIMILSSLSANELKKAIISSDTNKIKSVKGIGLKTAERIILELKDKVTFDDIDQDKFYDHIDNTIKDEALSALSSLGISKNIVEKHINDILDRNNDISLEDLIKEVLKRS